MDMLAAATFDSQKIFLEVDSTIKSKKPFLQPSDILEIEDLVRRVLLGESRIVYHISPSKHIFFSTDKLNFKMQRFRQTEEPFNFSMSMQVTVQEFFEIIKKGKSVCKTHQLKLLAIPDAEVIQICLSGKQQDVLVEKKLDLKTGSYDQLSEDVKTELARQLAIFILNTGVSDITINNLPLVNSKKTKAQKTKVGLINFSKMNSVYMGLFGGNKTTGLVHMFPSKKQTIFEEIEKKLGISISKLSLEDIKPNFDSFPKSKPKLIKIAHELYKGITLKKNCGSILDDQEDTNTFLVNTNKKPFLKVTKLNLDTDKTEMNFPSTEDGDREYNNATLIGIVTNEFIKLGFIKGVYRRNGHGWDLDL